MKNLKAIKNTAAVFLLAFATLAGAQDKIEGGWKRIDVAPGTYKTTDGNGANREISPSCSGGPVCTLDPVSGLPSCREGNKTFSFFFKQGKEKEKLIVYFDGGGACWDSNTCVTGQQTQLAAYVPEIRGNPGAEGLFNELNPKNPYRNWSVAFIPYCTADIHWGSKDQKYTDFTGAVTGTPGGEVTIHHRGFDNFLYVRDWLMKRYGKEDHQVKGNEEIEKLLLTGSSAGAYGAVFAYPHMKQAFPSAKGFLMADAGFGVVSDELLQQAVRLPDDHWGATNNIVHAIPGMDGIFNLSTDRFAQGYYSALAAYYPQDRFSEYSTLYDVIQALFYNISLNQNNIDLWPILTPEVYGAWTQQMVNNAFITAANPNYRFYIASGCNHTLLRFDDDFYKTKTTQDVSFLTWFKALTKDSDETEYPKKWSNSFCSGCEISPTPEEVDICLQRTLARE